MAATATRPLQTHRHHPYILPQSSPSTSSTTTLKRQSAPAPSRYAKVFSGTLSPRPTSPERGRSPIPNDHPAHLGLTQAKTAPAPANGAIPPSPPRSRRDPSETPSIGTQSGLGVAFGGSGGGKWWDEEIPPPPASLTAILDSFRQSGQGDRDLLLAILGAKKAEEERLTALISTRLTILQARLSLHSAAAALNAQQPPTPPEESSPRAQEPNALPNGSSKGSPPPDYLSPRPGGRDPRDARDEASREVRMAPPPLPQKPGQGLIPRGLYAQTPQSLSRPRAELEAQAAQAAQRREMARVDIPQVHVGRFWTDKRNTSPEASREPRRVPVGRERRSHSPVSPVSAERERKDRAGSHGSSGSESRAPGLDMLLDAGMRDQEMA